MSEIVFQAAYSTRSFVTDMVPLLTQKKKLRSKHLDLTVDGSTPSVPSTCAQKKIEDGRAD